MPYRRLTRAASRATGRLGWLRSALGAVLGIAVAAMITRLAQASNADALPWLAAPIGASAIMVFALPASPLAQPWPVLGGDLLSALAGLIVWHFLPVPLIAAPLAVGSAIAVMSLCRCLHPPGGACALLAVLSPEHGWLALMVPLACNVLALVAAAWLYNNVTGHSWPHHKSAAQPVPERWLGGYEESDLDAVLEQWDEVLDVSRDDLDALIRAVERRVQDRCRNASMPLKRTIGERGTAPLNAPADLRQEPGLRAQPVRQAREAALHRQE